MKLCEVIKTRVVKLPTGLTPKEAVALTVKSPGDYRGFKYNPKTGTAWLT